MLHRRSRTIVVIAGAMAALVLAVPESTASWIGVGALASGSVTLLERARRAGPAGSILLAFGVGLMCFTAHAAAIGAMSDNAVTRSVGGPVSIAFGCAAIVIFTRAVIGAIGPRLRQRLRLGPVLVSDLVVTFALTQVWTAVMSVDGEEPSIRMTSPLSIVSLGCAVAGVIALARRGGPVPGLFVAVPAFDVAGLLFVIGRQLGWPTNIGAAGCVSASAIAVWVAVHPDATSVFCRRTGTGKVHASWHTAARTIAVISPFVAWPAMTMTGGPSLGFAIIGSLVAVGFLVVFTVTERGGRRAAAEREAIADELALALRRGDFELHYQPLVRAATGRLTGVEALLRWTAPDHGEHGPEDIVEIALEHGLGRELSSHVITRVVDDLAVIRDVIGPIGDSYIAVNVTALDIQDPGFVPWLERALAEHDPAGLVLELSEKHPITDPVAVRRTMDALQTIGIAVALDDFGAGAANAAAVGAFDFDYVKLDRSLLVNAADSLRAERFLQGLVDSLRSLDIGIVAEGIEDRHQASIPRGLDLLQGWAFGAAVELSELAGLRTVSQPA